MSNPSYQPSKEAAALDEEVRRRKERLQIARDDKAIDDRAVHPDRLPENVLPLAEVMPDVVEAFTRMEQRARAFRDSLRPDYDNAPETEPCPVHPNVPLAKDFDATCQATRDAGLFTLQRARCPACLGEAKEADERRYWSRRGVPSRLLHATFANFDTDGEMAAAKATALAKVRRWSRSNGVFLLLIGKTGTGKGHLAAACLRDRGDGLFITHADMLSELRTSYTLNNTADLIAGWRETPAFVLDEFGLSPGGRDEESMLYQVLAARYDGRLRTILTSNMTVTEMQAALGFRLLDRIREECVLVLMDWPSYRTSR